ncbi:hypothetical protein BDA99DRAFT_444710, partial [Phascolomyces articulosus]
MTREKIPVVWGGAGFTIGDTFYVYGGQGENAGSFSQFTELSFDTAGVVQYKRLNENGPSSQFGQAVVLPGNESFAIIGGASGLNASTTVGEPLRASVYSFAQKSWTTLPGLEGADPSAVPIQRQEHTAVMAPNGLIYIAGGIPSTVNRTILADSWSYNPENGVFTALSTPPRGLYASTATALPDGRIVYIGGFFWEENMPDNMFGATLKYTRLVIYHTSNDTWTFQDVRIFNVFFGYTMMFLYYVLIYEIYKGDNNDAPEKRISYNHLWMLDTQEWKWYNPSIPGTQPVTRSGTSAGLLSQKYIVFGFGISRSIFYNSLDILLTASVTNEDSKEVDLTSPKWVNNVSTGEIADEEKWSPSGLSGGVIAAVVIVCVVVALMLLYLLYRFRYRVRRAIMRIHYGIWNPRTGEPLWAETARLISKVILLFLFLAFFVFVLIQVIRSPKATYIVMDTTPNARVCFEGFTPAENTEFGFEYPIVGCVTDAGDVCDDHLTKLDLEYYDPSFMGNLGQHVCYLFTGTKDRAMYDYETLLLDNEIVPQRNNGTNVHFTFYVNDKTENGRIHITFYPEKRNPNRVIFLAQHQRELNDQDIADFLESDNDDFDALHTVDLHPLDEGYVQYQLESKEYLEDVGWNYVGFAPVHNSTPEVSIVQRVQNAPGLGGGLLNAGEKMISRLTIAPASTSIMVHREQKIYSLVNAVGFIGGLFGLFVAFQTIMFGFRPRSPFGIVHRWSVGDMRRSISSGLKDRFDLNRTPVPLVNPV